MGNSRFDFRDLGRHFCIDAEFVAASRIRSGHINDTFAVTYRTNSRVLRYIHQRINQEVFKRPAEVMSNIRRVTAHLREKLRDQGISDSRRVLELVPTREGDWYHLDAAGNTWRTYVYIDGARTHDRLMSEEHAYQVARCFAEFQQLVADLTDPPLAETIVDFHNTPRRIQAFEGAVTRDLCNRASGVAPEIAFVQSQAGIAGRLIDLEEQGKLRLRVTHNDTKVNNVMIDEESGRGICVIDLDTVMPGLVHYDFGDLVRTAVSDAAEDERDLSRVRIRLPVFQALAEGYLSCAGGFLAPTEAEELAFAARLLTFENAVRFLTDYLSGDTYFRIHRPQHNLDRCRAQLQLYRELTEQEGTLREIVLKVYGEEKRSDRAEVGPA